MARQRKETLTTHELGVSSLVAHEALIRVLIKKGVITEEELLEEVRAVQNEMAQTQELGLTEAEKGP